MVRFFSKYLIKNYFSVANNFPIKVTTERYLLHVSSLRPYYLKQICYQKKLNFLSKKYGATHKLSSHLMRKGNLLMWLKFFKMYYVIFLRTNFLQFVNPAYTQYKFISKETTFYRSMYYFYNAIKDFDRVIIWRLFQVNSLFKFHFGIYRKRGKKKQELKLSFVNYEKRIYVAWQWFIIYLNAVGTDISQPNYILGALDNFILQPPQQHALTLFRLEVYRAQLLRMV